MSNDYILGYNIKRIVVDQLLVNFRESIDILLDNPEMADESIIRNKLKEFVLLTAKSQKAPLKGMVHKVEKGAKRFVEGINDESYASGVFYASKAIHRFIKEEKDSLSKQNFINDRVREAS